MEEPNNEASHPVATSSTTAQPNSKKGSIKSTSQKNAPSPVSVLQPVAPMQLRNQGETAAHYLARSFLDSSLSQQRGREAKNANQKDVSQSTKNGPLENPNVSTFAEKVRRHTGVYLITRRVRAENASNANTSQSKIKEVQDSAANKPKINATISSTKTTTATPTPSYSPTTTKSIAEKSNSRQTEVNHKKTSQSSPNPTPPAVSHHPTSPHAPTPFLSPSPPSSLPPPPTNLSPNTPKVSLSPNTPKTSLFGETHEKSHQTPQKRLIKYTQNTQSKMLRCFSQNSPSPREYGEMGPLQTPGSQQTPKRGICAQPHAKRGSQVLVPATPSPRYPSGTQRYPKAYRHENTKTEDAGRDRNPAYGFYGETQRGFPLSPSPNTKRGKRNQEKGEGEGNKKDTGERRWRENVSLSLSPPPSSSLSLFCGNSPRGGYDTPRRGGSSGGRKGKPVGVLSHGVMVVPESPAKMEW